MLFEVSASFMFPSQGSYRHGPPLVGRVPVPLGSPTSSLLFSPPTSYRPSASAHFPIAFGIRDRLSFRGCIPSAHTLAYLRFAHVVTDTGARLTSDLPDLALIGRVSHPLDDSSNFQ